MSILFILLIVAAFAVVFPAFWCGVTWLISQAGWSRLARVYETDTEPGGRRFHVSAATIGVANYNGVLRVHAEPEGLRLSVMPLFRVGHPPLLIPWDEITDIEPRQRLWQRAYALHVRDIATVTLPAMVVEAIQDLHVSQAADR